MADGAKLITAKNPDDKIILEEIKTRCSPLSGTIWLGAIKHDDVYETLEDKQRYKWIDSDTEYVNSSGLQWRTDEPNGDLHQGVNEAKIIEYNLSGMNDTKIVDFENRFICMKEANGMATTMTQEAIDFTNGTTSTPTPTPLRTCSTTTDYSNDTVSRNLCRDKSCANTAIKYKKIKKSNSDCEGEREIEVNCPARPITCSLANYYIRRNVKVTDGHNLSWNGTSSTNAKIFCEGSTEPTGNGLYNNGGWKDTEYTCDRYNVSLENVLEQCNNLDNCVAVQKGAAGFYQMKDNAHPRELRIDGNFITHDKKNYYT